MKLKILLIVFISCIFFGCQEEQFTCVNQESDCQVVNPDYDPSMLFAEWEEANTICTRSGKTIYPEWYGGSYQENEKLIFLCTDIDDKSDLPVGIQYRRCDYSYNELDSICDYISNCLINVEERIFSNVVGIGISNRLNKVEIVLRDTSDIGIDDLRNTLKIDDKYVIVRSINDLLKCSNSVNALIDQLPTFPSNFLACGSKLINPYTEKAASFGYRVKDSNGRKGFITAGHFVYEGKYVTTASGDTLGLCRKCYRRNIMDASYCDLIGKEYEMSNHIRTFAVDTLSKGIVHPIESASVITVGFLNTYEGKVLFPSIKITFIDEEGRRCEYEDQILMDFVSDLGNSGGVVCHRDKTTNELMTVGILGGNCTIKEKPFLGRTVAFCCKQSVIQNVMGVKRY